MDCLKNYIGLKGYSVLPTEEVPEPPESGLYINSLPGITSDILLKIAEAEDIETVGQSTDIVNKVWDNIQDVAAKRFYTDSIIQLKAGYNICYNLEGDNIAAPADEEKKYENIICSNKKLFASAWMFLLGNQACIELLYSSQSNQHTTVDREKYQELKDHYQVEYEKQLKTMIDSLCIESKKVQQGGNPKRVVWLP